MVDSWCCLDLVVLEGMSQVSRRSEVGNHNQRILYNQPSSGTSAGTFECPAGPYRNCKGEAGTEKGPKWHFVPDQEKRVRKSILTFRTQDLVDFVFDGFRCTFQGRFHFWNYSFREPWWTFCWYKFHGDPCQSFISTQVKASRVTDSLKSPEREIVSVWIWISFAIYKNQKDWTS